MCAKVISVSLAALKFCFKACVSMKFVDDDDDDDTCWATYSNQKTIPGQEVRRFYPFQALFMAYWGFQKYQAKVAKFAPRLGVPTAECFQLQGGFAT